MPRVPHSKTRPSSSKWCWHAGGRVRLRQSFASLKHPEQNPHPLQKQPPRCLPGASPTGAGAARRWCRAPAGSASPHTPRWTSPAFGVSRNSARPRVIGLGAAASRARTRVNVQGCSAPNSSIACRVEGATTRREKKHTKAQKINFWDCFWLKTKAPAWKQEEKRLPRPPPVLLGLSVPICVIPLYPATNSVLKPAQGTAQDARRQQVSRRGVTGRQLMVACCHRGEGSSFPQPNHHYL